MAIEMPLFHKRDIESSPLLVEKIEEVKVEVEDDGDEKDKLNDNKVESEDRKEDEENNEDTTAVDKGKGPKSLGFFQRFFRKQKAEDEEKAKDIEAGTELLRKEKADKASGKNGDIEVHNDAKQDGDKSDKTDTTAEVGGGDKEEEAVEKQSCIERLLGFPKERLVIFGVLIFLFLLVTIVIVGVLTTGSEQLSLSINGKYTETRTNCGPVQGLIEDNAMVFRGIPYALPPVGDRRWRPSELVSDLKHCWTGIYLAHNLTKLCYQKPLPHPFSDMEFNEDCLYLDVYTPRTSFEDPMPVVVYFAGDSFQGHDSMDFRWRPSAKLAREKQVVFVVVYYRMNAFGFLALELLTKNVHPPTSGNYGIHDMLTALKWVKLNIENFGGSSDKVTVLGHGSGATGVLALMSSHLAQLMFNQAWITGGSADIVNKTLREVERNNEAFNRHLMCDSTECLYGKTPEQILNAIPTSEWPFWGVPNHLDLPTSDEHTAAIAVVDGTILYDNPAVVWDEGSYADVGLVVGSSLDSVASRLIDEDFDNFDWEKFNSTVRSRLNSFGSTVAGEAIEKYYDGNSTATEQYIRMVSDLRVTCPLMDLALRASKVFLHDVYFYLVSHVPDGILEGMNFSSRMAVHGLDVAAIFGLIPEVLSNPSDADRKFQDTVQDAFYYFVRNGRFSPVSKSKMPWHLNWIYEELETSTERYAICDFWKRVGMYPKYARMN